MVTLFNSADVRAWCAEYGYEVRSTGATTREWAVESTFHSTRFRIGDTLVYQSARILVQRPRD